MYLLLMQRVVIQCMEPQNGASPPYIFDQWSCKFPSKQYPNEAFQRLQLIYCGLTEEHRTGRDDGNFAAIRFPMHAPLLRFLRSVMYQKWTSFLQTGPSSPAFNVQTAHIWPSLTVVN
ncbi:hypothetical protein HOLleu_25698 [Holothuria leucospilota]|uniref:Uncharacterized protein n=1 Tax=Holothuria leucospilota TaxID=206669 RepID=A0A9Q1BT87_HOLLE|nr:hypothetical protein HOLleu_25698 [Holothuria leucospilota]